MGRKRVLLVLGVVLILFIVVFVNAKQIENTKIQSSILEKNSNEKIRVFVKYDNKTPKNNILRMITLFSKEKKAKDFTSEESITYEMEEGFFAILTREEIENLALNNQIKEIFEEKKYYTFLQDSVLLINATSSWNLESRGINLTGEGQTICIIDTGIDYTHPDLGGCFGDNNPNSNCKVVGGWNTYYNNNYILDDQGHGTHVAGIASANGDLLGVAPNSKIIMIKANEPQNRSFNINDILDGMEWCINNATEFNISVISMSLGSEDLFNEYCDIKDSFGIYFSSRINYANSKNISVVVATGNDGSPSLISSPACIQNAIPTTSSIKSDNNLSSFSNRWSNPSLKILSAPGTNITSTYLNNRYAYANGTSMATPHVAGVIAIINQYLKSINKTKTPSEIEDLLNSTGKQIYDYESNRNFSRVDVYSALMEIDETPPIINLISPENNTLNETQNQAFKFNTSDWQLKNATLYLWDSNNNLVNNSMIEISGETNTSQIELVEIDYGKYYWNYLVCDKKSNCAFAENNYTFINQGINLELTPSNNTFTNINEISFTCNTTSPTESPLKNITFSIWNSSENLLNNSTNEIYGNSNISEFNFIFEEEGNYTWSCLVYNNDSVSEKINHTIIYDITTPNLTYDIEDISCNSAKLKINSSEEINYSIDLNSIQNNTFNLEHSISISNLNPSTEYNLNLSFCDRAGNCNISLIEFTTLGTPPTPKGGGGGGGGGVPPKENINLKVEDTTLQKGYNKNFNLNEKLSFTINNQNHSLQLNKIINNSINITIRSEPINLILKIGEEEKLNLTSLEYYDLVVKLESIKGTKANISIKKINERINSFNLIKYENNKSDEKKYYINEEDNTDVEESQSNSNFPWSYLISTLILITLIAIYFYRKRKPNRTQLFSEKRELELIQSEIGNPTP